MEHKEFITQGTCSKKITYDIQDGKVYNVKFMGGCQGNLNGISRLVEGMPQEKVAELLRGINCGPRSTSCPDQLAKSLSEKVV